MFDEAVKLVVKNVIEEDYPHVKSNAIMHGKILNAEACGSVYTYDVLLLNVFGNAVDNAVIPGVVSDKELYEDDIAVIGIAYGRMEKAYIIGKLY